jgi:outer membrane protein TolC
MKSKKLFTLAAFGALVAAAFPPAALAVPLNLNLVPASCAPAIAENPLSLETAIEMALCHHPDTRSAAAQVANTQALEGQSRAALMPHVSGSVSVNGTRAEDSPFTDAAQAQLKLSYVLFDFGRTQATVDAARAATVAAKLDSNAVAQTVILDTASKYFALLAAQQSEEEAKASLAAAKLSKEDAQEQFDKGIAPRLEVLQAQSLLASAELAMVRARSSTVVATAALAQQVGLRANEKVTVSALGDPNAVKLPPLEELMDEAKAKRPEAVAAKKRLEAAQARERAASAAGKPSLSFNVTGAQSQARGNAATGQMGVGFMLDIPLFDGGLVRNQLRQAQAQTELAAADLDSWLQATELRVVQAHAQLSTAQQAYRSAETFLKAAKLAQEQAEGRYRAGVGTLSDSLDAQAKLTSARQQRVATLIDWHAAKLELSRAVGSLSLSSI